MRRFHQAALAALSVMAATLSAAAPAPLPSMKLWRLDCGSFTAPRDNFSDLLSHRGERGTYVDSCYLIRHGHDLLLWDAGLPLALLGKPEDLSQPVEMRLTVTIADQLAQLGFRPCDVTILGISHLHSDHMGQAAVFPTARLVMDKGDFEALRHSPPPFFSDPALLRPWILGGAPADLVSGDHDIFGDGTVVMIALPGHTPGNHGLLIRLPHIGPVLLSGDALHESDALVNHDVAPSNASRADSLASLDRINGIVRETHATLVIQHDPGSVAKLPAFPRSAD